MSMHRTSAAQVLIVTCSLLFPWLPGWAEALEPSGTVPSFSIESYVLPNGLQVALCCDPSAPRTTVCVAYHVGSKNERHGLTGFAHFFEHMMFRGTQNVPDFDIPLQEAGGSPNAFTSEDVTVYFETVTNNYVQRALYMEAERMAFLSSALNQEKFDTEREVVKNERRERMENSPYGLADETISSAVYPAGHPYSWSVIGSMQDLNNATLDDLRQFFGEFYHPANATLTLVGGFDVEQARQWITTYFGVIARGPDVERPEAPATSARAARLVQQDRVQFSRVYWAWPTVSEADPDAAPLDLLAMLLADGDASRLMQAMVIQSPVAVDVSATSETSEIGGLFKISATVAPDNSVGEAETLIEQELSRLRTTTLPEPEVARLKARYRTEMLVGLTSPLQRTLVICLGLAKHDDPHYYRSLFTRYEAVTAADIQRVAARYLTADRVVLVVEPVQEGEAESPAVLAGPVPSDAGPRLLPAREHAPGPDWSHMPEATSSRPFVPPTFERRRLSNGLDVWLARWTTLPLVSARLVVRAGVADDSQAHAGLASLTAELWDQGTQQLTATAFAQAVDALGTSLGTAADTNTTQLAFTVESRSWEPMLELVGDMVTSPRLAPEDFDRERALQQNRLASGPDSASWIAGRVFPTLLFGLHHPYSLPPDGYAEALSQLTVEQVRAGYNQHFTPENSLLVVVGDIDPDRVMQSLEEKWGNWQGRSSVTPLPEARPTSQPGTVYLVHRPGAEQSVLVVSRVWKDRLDASYYATRIGNRVLGGDFLSRLMQNLRQKHGFTYGVRSGFDYYATLSNWQVTTSVFAEATGAALREIMRELQAVDGDRPLTAEEIQVAQAAETSLFPQSFETPSGIASVLAQLAIYRLPDNYFDLFLPDLQATRVEQVARATAELATPNALRILVVGDRDTVVPQLNEAGFTRIEQLDVDGQPVP